LAVRLHVDPLGSLQRFFRSTAAFRGGIRPKVLEKQLEREREGWEKENGEGRWVICSAVHH